MQPDLLQVHQYVKTKKDSQIENSIQNHKRQQQNNSINEILSGDLYIIGKIWIGALQKALTGANVDLVPIVHAAKLPEVPQRPPKMKYSDLPIYETPHYEYKEYIDERDKCPERNDKLLQQYLLPYVKYYRRIAKENFCSMICITKQTCSNTCSAISNAKNDFKTTMRDPNNLTKRQAVVGLGTLTGYLIGGSGGLPRRIFFTSAGFLATGALCYPKETDEIFRNVAAIVGKTAISLYNFACLKNSGLRERIACTDDLPLPPPQRKTIQCPPKN
ncbi:uncharacterized protein LOC120625266 [Pararge aegeria]|uniref:MICOS complex subunit n=1 Tax=Pararge aegeria aegeria TaxID=348720 RepID=A0A8S4R1T5_9NEOP|nr:uncharacterized protein LOC120625266 [Pararge aegeria]CAH2229326.1 jg17075 [Pararge aegeria aegeria]